MYLLLVIYLFIYFLSGEPAPKKARYENQNSFGKVVANNEEESVVADTFSDHSSRALHCSTNSVVSTVQVPSHSKPLEKIKRKGFTRKASINGPSSSASLLKSYPSNENNVSSDELEPSTRFEFLIYSLQLFSISLIFASRSTLMFFFFLTN